MGGGSHGAFPFCPPVITTIQLPGIKINVAHASRHLHMKTNILAVQKQALPHFLLLLPSPEQHSFHCSVHWSTQPRSYHPGFSQWLMVCHAHGAPKSRNKCCSFVFHVKPMLGASVSPDGASECCGLWRLGMPYIRQQPLAFSTTITSIVWDKQLLPPPHMRWQPVWQLLNHCKLSVWVRLLCLPWIHISIRFNCQDDYEDESKVSFNVTALSTSIA